MDLPQPVVPPNANAEWHAQYEFYTKIIEDEVARLRWNGGFEPLDTDLYRIPDTKVPTWLGKIRIAHRDFTVRLTEGFDQKGKKVLRLSIRTLPRP